MCSYIDDNTKITSTKYHTVGELKNAPIPNIIRTVSRMSDSHVRSHMDKWLFENHYIKQRLMGNLTNRVKQINSKICYRYIVQKIFGGYDPLSDYIIEDLGQLIQRTDIIHSLRVINPSLTGIFLDYLIRVIICQIRHVLFTDTRTENIEYSVSIMYPDFAYDISDSYQKLQDLEQYHIIDIIKNVFIVSISHSIAFGGPPQQETIESMLSLLEDNIECQVLIQNLTNICEYLFDGKCTVQLNPTLGCQLGVISEIIPSDCDIIADESLIDIKCVKKLDHVSNVLQLIGYMSMIHFNPHFETNIKKLVILDMMENKLYVYNAERLNESHLLNFLKLLSNQYNPKIQICIKK